MSREKTNEEEERMAKEYNEKYGASSGAKVEGAEEGLEVEAKSETEDKVSFRDIGHERVENVKDKLKNFFGGIKRKVGDGVRSVVDYTAATPEMVGHAGGKVASAGKETAEISIETGGVLKDSLERAGRDVYEGAVGIKNNLAEKGRNAKESLFAGFESFKNKTKNKFVDLKTRGQKWGLDTATKAENRVNVMYGGVKNAYEGVKTNINEKIEAQKKRVQEANLKGQKNKLEKGIATDTEDIELSRKKIEATQEKITKRENEIIEKRMLMQSIKDKLSNLESK